MSGFHWTFRQESDRADFPDPDELLKADGETVKHNPFRTVKKVTLSTGRTFYLKFETPTTWLRILRERVCSKSKAEFRMARLLAERSIPCVEYPLFGRAATETLLVSPALEGFISCTEYVHSFPLGDVFLNALTALVRKLCENKILHPDFHTGNLMVRPDMPSELRLIDLAGIRFTHGAVPYEENGHILTDLSPFLTTEQGEQLFRDAGADPACWHRELARTMDELRADWPRRIGQILSGDSKFARPQTVGGETYIVRTTPWFTDMPFDPKDMRMETHTLEEARGLWLESFRREIFREKTETPRPAAFRETADGSAVLYYGKSQEKKQK